VVGQRRARRGRRTGHGVLGGWAVPARAGSAAAVGFTAGLGLGSLTGQRTLTVTWAMISVIVGWIVGWSVIGAWRMMTRDA
jgi:hypothetical protein